MQSTTSNPSPAEQLEQSPLVTCVVTQCCPHVHHSLTFCSAKAAFKSATSRRPRCRSSTSFSIVCETTTNSQRIRCGACSAHTASQFHAFPCDEWCMQQVQQNVSRHQHLPSRGRGSVLQASPPELTPLSAQDSCGSFSPAQCHGPEIVLARNLTARCCAGSVAARLIGHDT